MRTPIRQRQFRGLVLHHRRHPATHPRRLVNRTADGESRRETASDAGAMSGRRISGHMEHLLPECLSGRVRPASRGDTAHALRDLRWSVWQAGAPAFDRGGACPGTSGDAQSIHAGQPALAMPELPLAQDTSGPAIGEVPCGVLARLVRRSRVAQAESEVGAVVHAAVQPGNGSAAGKCGTDAATCIIWSDNLAGAGQRGYGRKQPRGRDTRSRKRCQPGTVIGEVRHPGRIPPSGRLHCFRVDRRQNRPLGTSSEKQSP